MESIKKVVLASKPAKINFSDITLGTRRNKSVPIYYEKNSKLIVQSPWITVRENPKAMDVLNYWNVETNFNGDTVQKNDEWYNFMLSIEEAITELITNHGDRTEWFTERNIDYKSLLRRISEKENETEFFIRWVINTTVCHFTKENGDKILVNEISKDDSIRLIVEFDELMLDGNKYTLSYTVLKVLSKQTKKEQLEFDFDDSQSEEDTKNYAMFATDKKVVTVRKNVVNENVFSDDDDDSDSDNIDF